MDVHAMPWACCMGCALWLCLGCITLVTAWGHGRITVQPETTLCVMCMRNLAYPPSRQVLPFFAMVEIQWL